MRIKFEADLSANEIDDILQLLEEEMGDSSPGISNFLDKLQEAREKADIPDYELSKTQKAFVKKAKKEGHKIRWDYSGRGMFGAKCPAVVCPWGEFAFAGAYTDNMGRDMVIYVPY